MAVLSYLTTTHFDFGAVRLLPKELDHEDGELTATQKVKRSAVTKSFEEMVESMYGGGAR